VVGQNFVRDAHFTGIFGVLALAAIFFREGTNHVVRPLFGFGDDGTAHLDVAVQIRGVGNRQCDARVAAQNLVLDGSARGVDDNVRAVIIEPDRRHLGRTIFFDKRQKRECFFFARKQVGEFFGN